MGQYGFPRGHLIYFTTIWYILWSFGICILWSFWYIFPRFGILYRDKSGNPGQYIKLECGGEPLGVAERWRISHRVSYQAFLHTTTWWMLSS
jgi:hypothetical protein